MGKFVLVSIFLLAFAGPSFLAAAAREEVLSIPGSENSQQRADSYSIFEARSLGRSVDSRCPLTTCSTTGVIRQTATDQVNPESSLACSGRYTQDKNSDLVFESYTASQTWARCFILDKEGCSEAVVVESVTFGVLEATENPVSVRINIFRDCGCHFGAPGSSQDELIGSSADITVTDKDDLSLITVAIEGNVALSPHDAIRVEIDQLSEGLHFADDNPLRFWPGATTSAASADAFARSRCTGGSYSPWQASTTLILTLQTSKTTGEPTPLSCCTQELCDEIVEECSDDLSKCVLKPECKDPPLDSCDFYSECVEAAFECGVNGYPIKFGDTMCNIYRNNEGNFSDKAKGWSSRVRLCLQEALVPILEERGCNTCDSLEHFAVDSHTRCYIETGFCNSMTPRDLVYLGWLTKGAFVRGAALDIVEQLLSVARSCGSTFFTEKFAAVDAAFNESMEELLDKFDGVQSRLVDYLLREVFEPHLPDFGEDILPNYMIWGLYPGSTHAILLIVDHGTFDPEDMAKNVTAGLAMSSGGSLNLTYTGSTTCINNECQNVLAKVASNGTSPPTQTSPTESPTESPTSAPEVPCGLLGLGFICPFVWIKALLDLLAALVAGLKGLIGI